jgi:hypothetical protein
VRALGREEVLARAERWARASRRYSQRDCDPESGYRLDCSGYVSMAWRLEAPGLTTVELPDLCAPIANDDLRPGDVVMIGGPGTEGDAGHAILFEAWADPGRASFWAYEHTGRGTLHRVVPVPPSPPYRAYRYQLLLE